LLRAGNCSSSFGRDGSPQAFSILGGKYGVENDEKAEAGQQCIVGGGTAEREEGVKDWGHAVERIEGGRKKPRITR
jgi:hypothetical protein